MASPASSTHPKKRIGNLPIPSFRKFVSTLRGLISEVKPKMRAREKKAAVATGGHSLTKYIIAIDFQLLPH
jgi:hypothetical protein